MEKKKANCILKTYNLQTQKIFIRFYYSLCYQLTSLNDAEDGMDHPQQQKKLKANVYTKANVKE